ncbi:hypothetical protein E8F11_11310 [Pseudomonas sp. BN417]|nr:hypothetical protein [Pseudomonas sp. BN417]
MVIAQFVASAESHLALVLDRAGCILYSAAQTLCPGDIYVLGLNPGGEGGPTIGQHLEKLPCQSANAYLDESWENRAGTYSPGNAPLQRRLAWLIRELGYDLRNVCASNLVFMKSRDASGIVYPLDADLCWPVHEQIIGHVQPKLILAFGNSPVSPYGHMRQLFQGHEEMVPSGHGSWSCRGFEAELSGRKVFIAGLPHLSRYSPIGRREVVDWLKSKISL